MSLAATPFALSSSISACASSLFFCIAACALASCVSTPMVTVAVSGVPCTTPWPDTEIVAPLFVGCDVSLAVALPVPYAATIRTAVSAAAPRIHIALLFTMIPSVGVRSSDDGAGTVGSRLGSNSVRSRYVTTNGIRLFCLESGPPAAPLVLLLHGFPELAYSWRHQIAALGAAGFHVVAPDLPG